MNSKNSSVIRVGSLLPPNFTYTPQALEKFINTGHGIPKDMFTWLLKSIKALRINYYINDKWLFLTCRNYISGLKEQVNSYNKNFDGVLYSIMDDGEYINVHLNFAMLPRIRLSQSWHDVEELLRTGAEIYPALDAFSIVIEKDDTGVIDISTRSNFHIKEKAEETRLINHDLVFECIDKELLLYLNPGVYQFLLSHPKINKLVKVPSAVYIPTVEIPFIPGVEIYKPIKVDKGEIKKFIEKGRNNQSILGYIIRSYINNYNVDVAVVNAPLEMAIKAGYNIRFNPLFKGNRLKQFNTERVSELIKSFLQYKNKFELFNKFPEHVPLWNRILYDLSILILYNHPFRFIKNYENACREQCQTKFDFDKLFCYLKNFKNASASQVELKPLLEKFSDEEKFNILNSNYNSLVEDYNKRFCISGDLICDIISLPKMMEHFDELTKLGQMSGIQKLINHLLNNVKYRECIYLNF